MWFLAELSMGDLLEDVLLECRSAETRKLVADLISSAIAVVSPYEEEAFYDVPVEGEPTPERYRFDDADAVRLVSPMPLRLC